jgi:ABC-type thiamin/hydroxymethylpyrimidine transport system permease subunit
MKQTVLASETQRASQLRSFSVLIVLSALGGLTSVPVGYVGSFFSALALFPLAVPQLLAGLHVFWLVLAALLVRTRGSATSAGALKGLIEAAFFSHLGIFAFVVSLLEGAVVDLVFALMKKDSMVAVYLAGGFSSASNLLVVQFFLAPQFSSAIYGLGYGAAFVSGLFLGGYLAAKVFRVLPNRMF